jgi:arabinose operon protein AraL
MTLPKLALDGFIFDLDGTIYLGDDLLPGVRETIKALRQSGKRILFISNKPLSPRTDYAEKLTRLGIPTDPDEIFTSAYILGHYLINHYPEYRYYLIGEEKLRQELGDYGLNIVAEFLEQDDQQVIKPTGVDAVIVAFDRTLSYRKLNTAYQALLAGAAFFATNTDKACPFPGGSIPDAGGTVTFLEHLTGRKLELLAGKPSLIMIQVALDLLNLPPEHIILIGDRLETDILMGQQAGIHTALVLTGVSRREDVALASYPPEFVLPDMYHLVKLVEGL